MNATTGQDFTELVHRLNDSSVRKRYEAFRDIDWNGPDSAIDPRDPRWRLPAVTPLGGTDWYRSLPGDVQSVFGLEWTCQVLRFGVSFEACLTRGLLELASVQPSDSPLLRYAMHEVIEESHHSMMFLELIRRSGCKPHDVPRTESFLQRHVVARWGATFPELFFMCVLAGEVFIDHDNRERLRGKDALHPLLRRVLQIHVTEEARHVCFAEGYLRERLPLLSSARRRAIAIAVPFVLRRGEEMMLRPPPSLIERYAIPRGELARAFGPESEHQRSVAKITAPILELVTWRLPRSRPSWRSSPSAS